MTALPAPVAVFVGGCLGGALRLALDHLIADAGGVPLDIVVINLVGSFALGMLTAHALVHGIRWWTPLLGTGALGGFTTFSALAALTWTGASSAGAALALLVATMVGAVACAGVGWRLGARDPQDARDAR